MILSSSLKPLLPLSLQPGIHLFLTLFSGWTPHSCLLYPVLILVLPKMGAFKLLIVRHLKTRGRKKVVHHLSSRKTRWLGLLPPCTDPHAQSLGPSCEGQLFRKRGRAITKYRECPSWQGNPPIHPTSPARMSLHTILGTNVPEAKTNVGRIQGQLKWLSTVGLGTRTVVKKNSVMFSIKMYLSTGTRHETTCQPVLDHWRWSH